MFNLPHGPRCRLALAMMAAVLGCAFAGEQQPFVSSACAQEAKADEGQEFYFSLKSFAEDRGFRRIGPQNEECVHFDAEGMRITLPAGWKGERPNTGLRVPCPLKGDFSITVSFEVLKEPDLTDAREKATKLSLLAYLDSPVGRKAGFTQRYLPGEGSKVTTWINFKDPETGKYPSKFKAWNITAKNGQLRLVRSGPEVAFYLAEGNADFALIQRYPLGEEDLKEVDLVCSTGGPKASIDVRFSDLRIRSGAVTSAAAPEAPEGRSWRLLSVALVGAVVILLSFGMILFLRRRRPAGFAEGSTGMAYLTVRCSACGKDLKAKAEFAGKQVKCPNCGQAVLLPASTMPRAGEPSQVPAKSKKEG